MINPHTGRPFTKDFFKEYARGKPCLIRIAALEGLSCASEETTVLCHISLPGIKAMGKKLVPDLLGAWGCGVCHDLVDARYKPKHLTREEIELYHYHGMARTLDQLVRDGVLPNP